MSDTHRYVTVDHAGNREVHKFPDIKSASRSWQLDKGKKSTKDNNPKKPFRFVGPIDKIKDINA